MTDYVNEQDVMERRFSVPYNWCAKEHARMWRQKNGLWELARGLSGDLKEKIVLDAGCGDGWYTARMSKESNTVTGIDYSERAIAFAKAINPHATFLAGSITKLPFPDATFDVIFSFQVLEHIPLLELPSAIAELSRVLKPDGTFIATVPSMNRPMSTAHFQHFTKQSFEAMVGGSFRSETLLGQEHHTIVLHCIERVLHNRLWLLEQIAGWFNKGPFLAHWNRTTVEKGYNIVARCLRKG